MNKLKDIIKRFLVWIGAAAMLLSIGCAKAPSVDAAAQKNTEQIIEIATVGMEPQPTDAADRAAEEPAAATPAPVSPLYAKLGAPERYTVELVPDTDKLVITVDADVILPDAEAMPTVRISARDFSQDEVTRLFTALCGDTVMYKPRTQATRAEIQEQIQHFEEELKTAADTRREKVKENIAYYERALISAPETVADEVCDGTMTEQQLGVNEYLGKYMAVSAREHTEGEGGGKAFSVSNNTYDINTKSEYDFPVGASISYRRRSNSIRLIGQNPYVFIFDESAVPADAVGELSLTPAEARALVEAFWAESGFANMGVSGVWLAVNRENERNKLEDDPYGQKHIYVVSCAQSVNGVVPRNVGARWDGLQWAYENCVVVVSDAGIERLNWGSPYAYGEIVTADTQILPFTRIDEIFRKMMLVKYEHSAHSNASAKLFAYHVDRIALELQRVTERSSHTEGLLIPVWNFYGTYQYDYTDGDSHGSEDRQAFPASLLCINAIDGSIIEEGEGH